MAKKILSDETVSVLARKLEDYKQSFDMHEIGHVVSVKDGVASICGLDSVMMGELVMFYPKDCQECAAKGIVQNMTRNIVDVIVLDGVNRIAEGFIAKRTNTPISVPVGTCMLGRVVNALGSPVDGKGEIGAKDFAPIEREAPTVVKRQPVNEPINTGIKAIDCLVPIGRGQRELIVGDRKTGKTSLAIDTIIHQKKHNDRVTNAKDKVYCVYVAIGQKQSAVAAIHNKLEESGAMEYTTIVLAGASEPASMLYIAPYSGCAIAEFFLYKGMHCIIVYDDLSKHAVAYRELSLLLRNPPGREAYPGDVFYLHSRLLERAAKLSHKYGGGSLTALPVVETQADDVSSYIPTNVISITDGQIFLSSALVNMGTFPAINVGLSVSRVGSAAQVKAIKKLAGSVKLDLAQYREMEGFARFGSELDPSTQRLLDRGARTIEIFKQGQYSGLTFAEQALMLLVSSKGLLDSIAPSNVVEFEKYLLSFVGSAHADILSVINDTGSISDSVEEVLIQIINTALNNFDIK